MRFGGPIFLKNPDPAAWTAELKRLGYRAAYAPVDHTAAPEVEEYNAAAAYVRAVAQQEHSAL